MSPIAILFRCFAEAACLLVFVAFVSSARGDGPPDNIPNKVRPVPPLGIELTEEVTAELLKRARQIRDAVEIAADASDADRADVLVFARAIELACEQATFFKEPEIEQARGLAAMAIKRVSSLQAKKSSTGLPQWLLNELETASKSNPNSSLIVGGFRSKIDGSIQPYGLVVPKSYKFDDSQPMRLDVWLHGRGEQVCEVQFLHQRSTQVGEISPADTIVLHPFGRYCNAFKFAGEVDVLEAIEHVKTLFPIDDDRINIRGFSMGGAGCWQMAVHYPGMWMAATPGAGFCETTQFLKTFQQEEFVPTAFQKPLLHWYDCPDWGNNLRYLPTIAYSGELDKQKQAADLMEQTLRERGIEIPHLIGPQTAHSIHPDAKVEMERRLSELSRLGRPKAPREIDFTTYTLHYHQSGWVSIDRLETHWVEARVQAKINASDSISVSTQNILGITLGPIADASLRKIKSITIDGQVLAMEPPADLSRAKLALQKVESRWALIGTAQEPTRLSKRPGLQGPIDDAFLSPFVFVSPYGSNEPSVVDKWASSECTHAQLEWHRHFRGDALVKNADEITAEDKQSKNLILFGTAASNPLIAEVMKSLPLEWTGDGVGRAGHQHPATSCAIVAIYPSPFAADRYVVINSGFTFREYAYLNNARQIPMLPDWAIVDITGGATTQLPGSILEAGFFDEEWKLK